MVWKLFKHELKSSYRTFMFAYTAFLLCTLLLAISGKLNLIPISYEVGTLQGESSGSLNMASSWINFLLGVLVILYVLTMVIVMAVTCVNIVRGYKKSMFDHDAYLTHTLPVAQWQLLLVKVLGALTWIFASFLVSMLSYAVLILMALSEELGRGWYPFLEFMKELVSYGFTHKELYIVLFVILADLTQIITLIYCIINLMHSAYVHRYRTVIGIVLFVGVCLCQSGLENVIADIGLLPHDDMMQNLVAALYYVGYSALWFFASVYLLKHKMEVE